MKSNYKNLGPYIDFLDSRALNHESILDLDSIRGISSISKDFIKTRANLIGVVADKYKVVESNFFAYNPNTARMGDKIPIALNQFDYPVLVSSIYPTFKIKNTNELHPEYLMMWFRRPEFDRYARFMSHGSAREIFDWEEMCNTLLPVPHIDKQREIVKEYNVIQNRIALNQQLIQKLEETAQAIYKKWFEEGCESWTWTAVKDFCIDMKSGGTPSRAENNYWNSNDIPWIKTGEIKNNILIQAEEYISNSGLKSSSAKLLPKDTVLMSMYGVNASDIGILKFEATTNQACCGMICKNPMQAAFLYYHLLHNQKFIATQAIGGAQENLSKDYIEKLEIPMPDDDKLNSPILKTIIDNKEIYTRQNQKLTKLKELLLSKLATI